MRMFLPHSHETPAKLPPVMEKRSTKLIIRTLLKLNAYYAFPALSNGEPQEPYTSTCLNATRAMVALIAKGREIGWVGSSSPLFIWSCWVAARVLFGMSPAPFLSFSLLSLICLLSLPNPFHIPSRPYWHVGRNHKLIPVYSFLSHRSQPDDDFDIIVSALKEQSQYWTLASTSPSPFSPFFRG